MKNLKPHPHHWIVEPLFDEASYEEKAMFGCRACYLRGELKLVLAAKKKPWNGLLIPTDQERHESLFKEFPQLLVHPVIGKWLYLSENEDQFEALAEKIVRLIKRGDLRIGVLPSEERRSASSKSPPKTRRKTTQAKVSKPTSQKASSVRRRSK